MSLWYEFIYEAVQRLGSPQIKFMQIVLGCFLGPIEDHSI